MQLSAVDLAWIRDEIGDATPPTDNDLQTSYDELGTREYVALRVLKRRRADLLQDPASFSISGVLSKDASANLRALDEQIKPLQTAVDAQFGGLAGASSVLVGRADRSR